MEALNMNETAQLTAMNRQALITLLESYRPARALMAAVEVGVFDGLAAGAATVEELAGRLELPARSLGILLNACRVMGMLEMEAGRYRNAPAAEAYLVEGKPTYIGHAAKLESMFFWHWGSLTDTIRSGAPIHWDSGSEAWGDKSASEAAEGAWGGQSSEGTAEASSGQWGSGGEQSDGQWGSDGGQSSDEEWSSEAWAQKFIWAMHDRAVGKAELLAEHLDLAGRKQLYDVGGGSGAFSVALVRHNPGLRAAVFDVPTTLPITRAVIEGSDVSERITLQPGDYHEDEFGEAESNDVVLFSGVLNAEGEESCLRLLGKAHRALAPGGLLVVRDYLLDEQGGSQVAALFSLHMMMVTEHGQTHSEAEMLDWAAQAGFQDPTLQHMPAPDESTLVMAWK